MQKELKAVTTDEKDAAKYKIQMGELRVQAREMSEALMRHVDQKIVLSEHRINKYIRQTEDSTQVLLDELSQQFRALEKQRKSYVKAFGHLFGPGTAARQLLHIVMAGVVGYAAVRALNYDHVIWNNRIVRRSQSFELCPPACSCNHF